MEHTCPYCGNKIAQSLDEYIVLYRTNGMTYVEDPFGFQCAAEDTAHAEEQCLNAYPDAEVVWVHKGKDYRLAIVGHQKVRRTPCT